EMVGIGTIVEGATLELVQMPVTSTCRACGNTETGDEKAIGCQRCEASTMDHAGGDVLVLESIEYRPTEPATAGSAPN
ncbi:MAG: hydrogenase maturation nickel metallochaperone HypA, partial [Chloroflexi bacterium]|nr:hydrogenase maturation nickel metallochaperone HypA [Chloroflexota bacterium]